MDLGLDDQRRLTQMAKKQIALARFRARFPKPVARALEPFRRLQWQLMLGCAWSERFLDLLGSNPVLAYLWIRQEPGPSLRPRRFEDAAGTPQRHLLGQLGVPASKSALKLLRKVYVPALAWEMAEGLLAILRQEDQLARLRHVDRLNTGTVCLGRRPEFLTHCTPTLLSEVSEAKDELYAAPTAARIENHLEMCRALAVPTPIPFRSREHLHTGHRELLARYQEHLRTSRHATTRSGNQFGLPPVPGTQTIQPLLAEPDLIAEGREQDNCVATYAQRVRNGTHYIYRVTWPQRCTLSIVRDRDGRWARCELEISGNRPASPQSRQTVDAWLQRSQRLLDRSKD